MSDTNDHTPSAQAAGSEHLPDWVDRISFRAGSPGEIILRVPGWDEFGERMATNHTLDWKLGMRLAAELVGALEKQSPNAEVSGPPAEANNQTSGRRDR